MKRPLCIMAVPVIFIALLGSIASVDFFLIFLFIIFSFIPLLIFIRNRSLRLQIFSVFIFTLISLLIISIRSTGYEYINRLESDKLQNEDCWVVIRGRVGKYSHIKNSKDNPRSTKRSTNFTLNGAHVFLDSPYGSFLQKTYYPAGNIYVKGPFTDIGINDLVEVRGRLEKFSSDQNDVFNEKSYYRSIGISSKCSPYSVIVISKNRNPFFILADLMKKQINSGLSRNSRFYAGELKSIISGDQGDLSRYGKKMFTNNGIGHLLAISGLHISFLGMRLYNFLKRSGLSFILSSVISGTVICLYSVSAGLPISSVRALSMFMVLLGANITGRAYDPYSALCLQAVISILHDPYVIQGPSFILSYGAVLFLIIGNAAFSPLLIRLRKKNLIFSGIAGSLFSSVYIFLGILPFNLLFFGSVPVYSLLINLFILPLAGLLIILSLSAVAADLLITPLFGSSAAAFIMRGPESIIYFFEFICRKTSTSPLAIVIEASPDIPGIFVYYIFLFTAFYIIKRILR
ncbi:MAG: ComEC/Rec2 family competence protein [Clostridiales bacterium]|nr:ComEC/Rec2 family competence protein [Clostridiales bacterium]MBS5877242.1 ComEC/Rec2 family competence protein [Clostridiales bacterium]MDU1041948.1 ComEC/Rec2 family competence protein [Clostridiales bacterium]MDU3490967.1 ComEC/Rec2 family competence protein [Clostridiales bacterium]